MDHCSNSNGETPAQNDDEEPLHVFDLPQLHTKPSATNLLAALDLLTIETTSWNKRANSASPCPRGRRKVDPVGVPHYLTTIISSSLTWLPTDADRAAVHSVASLCLAQRAGRTALPSLTRTFHIPLYPRSPDSGSNGTTKLELPLSPPSAVDGGEGDPRSEIAITLHEPGLVGTDYIGLKTWAAAHLLARSLCNPSDPRYQLLPSHHRPCMLELGAGTGLVGIAAAAGLGANVVLTDLPAIATGNLAANVRANQSVIERRKGAARAAVLDWLAHEDDGKLRLELGKDKFGVVVAADCVYERAQAGLVAKVVERWLEKSKRTVLMVESPVREGFDGEMKAFREELGAVGLAVREEGTESGYDDWEGEGDELRDVECWWAVWGWREEILNRSNEMVRV